MRSAKKCDLFKSALLVDRANRSFYIIVVVELMSPVI